MNLKQAIHNNKLVEFANEHAEEVCDEEQFDATLASMAGEDRPRLRFHRVVLAGPCYCDSNSLAGWIGPWFRDLLGLGG